MRTSTTFKQQSKTMISKHLFQFQEEILQFSLAPSALEVMLGRGWRVISEDNEPGVSGSLDKTALERFRKLLYRTMLSLSSLYEDNQNSIPGTKSESWYTLEVWSIFIKILVSGREILSFDHGEKCSVASGQRKNNNRHDSSTRQAVGSKMDWLISCGEAYDELFAMEAGKHDRGATGTKAITDGVKLPKVMKDMFNRICGHCQWRNAAMENLEVYGLLISQLRVDFLSLRHIKGHFYRLKREQSFTIPTTLTEKSIRRILVIISVFLQLRIRMETMANNIEDWSNPDDSELKDILTGNRSVPVQVTPPRTLTFP
ncbi:hypothetical protein BGZ76_004487, partial [Entomortierella beljakovae]